MFLKKFIYVNWGNIPALEFDFGPINLLSGGNGSGKTTAADAIQTIMTAAHDTLFTYNPGQDEASQRGRNKTVRTLASYVLGCDDGSYARPEGAVGYLAACFSPTKGEQCHEFTALIGVSASLDTAGNREVARQNDIQFFILPEQSLQLSDLVTTDQKGQKHVVALSQCKKQLQQRLGDDFVQKYDTKRQYLRRLYAAFKGQNDSVSEREALNAAKAFSRFMAYKPVKSINGFVANEILEPRDLGEAIRTVSDLMKTIYSMESEASALNKGVLALSQTQSKVSGYIEKWIEQHVLSYLTEKNRFMQQQAQYLQAKQEQKHIHDQIEKSLRDKQISQDRRDNTREQLLSLEAKRQGIESLQEKDQCEQIIKQGNEHLGRLAKPLLEQHQAAIIAIKSTAEIHRILTKSAITLEIDGLKSKQVSQQAHAIQLLHDKEAIDFNRLLGHDWVDISPLENHLEQALATQAQLNSWYQFWYETVSSEQGENLRDQVQFLLERKGNKLEQIRRQMKAKQADIDALQTAQVNYPFYTRLALEAIIKECPQADPRVLCDYVDVIDDQWQNAIEGYIGGARFSILVNQTFEAEAISIVRAMPKSDARARIVQGSKAKKDASRQSVSPQSIIHLMQFEHATARDFLIAMYASVEQVKNAEQLAGCRRGLSAHGMGSGGYAMFRCDMQDSELVFGQGARERALTAKRQELHLLAQTANAAEQDWLQVKHLLQAVNCLQILNYGESINAMLQQHRSITQAEQALQQMDLSDFTLLEQEFSQLKHSAIALDQTISALDVQFGELENSLKISIQRCQLLEEQQAQVCSVVEQREQSLKSIATIWPEFDWEQQLQIADQQAGDNSQSILDKQLMTAMTELNARAHEIERLVVDHNLLAQSGHIIVYTPDYTLQHNHEFFQCLCLLSREIDRVSNQIQNNILVEKRDQLLKLKDDFNNAFVLNLCHSIYQAINDGKAILEGLNKELEHHRFGADKEKYRFDWQWVPEFKEYWEFFKEIINNPELGDGQNLFNADFSEKSQQVRDQLMKMLLDDDGDTAMRELERLSDYRNYRQYDIFKEPLGKQPIALSQYGTGSGGQLETPAYIIRSAAITSAFRFNEGSSHLRMVLVDEAFSKMDETRSKEVIDYLTKTQGLQLLFIMPTSKSGPFMDLISNQFVFTKVPLAPGKRVGTLNSMVLVDRQICNQQQIQQLWANHRRIIRKQAELDFLDLL